MPGYPHTLRSRVAASVKDANKGMAVLLQVEADRLDEARRLVGDAPVIVATREEAIAFLEQWMAPIFKRKRW